MRAVRAGWLLLLPGLGLGCGDSKSASPNNAGGAGGTGGTGGETASGPATLDVWMTGAVARPGGWADGAVRVSGDSGDWELSTSELPEGVSVVFEPVTVAQDHGAVARFDLAADAAPFSSNVTVRATQGARTIEHTLPLYLTTNEPEGFVVQLRQPLEVLASSEIVAVQAGAEARGQIQVLAIGDFEGDVQLLSHDLSGLARVEPGLVHVAPGQPGLAEVSALVTTEGVPLAVSGVSGRVVQRVETLDSARVETPPEPALYVPRLPRVWLASGESVTGSAQVVVPMLDTLERQRTTP